MYLMQFGIATILYIALAEQNNKKNCEYAAENN